MFSQKLISAAIVILYLLICTAAHSTTLQEAFAAAPPSGEYEKYLELETGVIYTGGLLVGKILDPITAELSNEPGIDVKICGNGAILDLNGEQICISYCENRLDIENCIILNGNIRYRGINLPDEEIFPYGSVEYCTFYKPHDYAIRLQGAGGNITLERNIFIDAIETGDDFRYINGTSAEWLPTGANVAISIFYSTYGVPLLWQNWSFHSDELTNTDSCRHFVALCEYG